MSGILASTNAYMLFAYTRYMAIEQCAASVVIIAVLGICALWWHDRYPEPNVVLVEIWTVDLSVDSPSR